MISTDREAIPQGHIGWLELTAILVVMATAKIYLIYSERMLRAGATASWSIPLIAGVLSLGWLLPLVHLLQKYPGKSLIEITRQLAGRPLAWAFGLVLFAYLLVVTATALEEVATILAIGILPLSPVRYLALIILAFAFALAMLGLEPLGRLCVFVIAGAFISIIVLALVSTPTWNYHHLFPLQGLGIAKVFAAGAISQAMYAEFIVIGLLTPYIRFRSGKSARIRRSVKWAWASSILIFTTVVLGVQMILPYPAGVNDAAPLLRAARELYLSRFFQRFDVVFLFFWIVAAVAQLAIGLYSAGLALSSAFSIHNHRPLVLLTAVLSLAYVQYVYDYSFTVVLDFDLMRPSSTVFVYVWVFVVLALSYLRRRPARGGDKAHA
ncbi:MAG: GerAB/ArcD/ProY family transporter [Bacillota bacterium]|nr:GerAB/ArcD/ProY family transporter [Bacillota bacterium]